MLVKAGYDEKRAEEIVLDRFEFEKKMAAHMYDLETSYREDYQEMTYNPYSEQELSESRINRLKNDTHAPEALRVNVNLAQYDKFYEVYGIKEGDAMYTAPEDRLKVW